MQKTQMKRFKNLLLFCFCLFVAFPGKAQIPYADSLVAAIQERQDIPGMAVAVWKKGEIVWAKGYGFADLEQQVPVDPFTTRFRIGSISKPLAGAALARTYEQGKINLDASIYTYLPDFPKKKYDFTTRQLAGHIAGVRHYNGTEFLLNERFLNVRDGLKIFENDTLLFEPGSKYNYSTYGWNLLSAVLEKAAGVEFLELMEKEVIKPLALTKTHADWPQEIIPFRTRFYAKEDGKIVNAPAVDQSIKWAGGGYLSTTDDLIKFGLAFMKPGYLKAETLSQWLSSQKTSDGNETGYGMGWRVGNLENKYPWFGHSGGSIGGTSWLVVFPEHEVIVVIFGNMSSIQYGQAPFLIGKAFLENE
jgi:serine beta-lactamase-like protein LACTB, mitochondrial